MPGGPSPFRDQARDRLCRQIVVPRGQAGARGYSAGPSVRALLGRINHRSRGSWADILYFGNDFRQWLYYDAIRARSVVRYVRRTLFKRVRLTIEARFGLPIFERIQYGMDVYCESSNEHNT